jgi:hypothetical protein
VRWWKRFREDLDRPAFQAGIEKFGTGFSHDVDRVWQTLCCEEGKGIRQIPLTDEIVAMLARQFRVSLEEAYLRLEFMAAWNLIELREKPRANHNSNGVTTPSAAAGKCGRFITSNELRRRRDEWSRRKDRETKKKRTLETPESLRSYSGGTPEQMQKQKQSTKTKINPRGAKAPLPGKDLRNPKIADPRFQQVVDFYFQEYQTRFGLKPDFDPTDGQQLARFLERRSEPAETLIRWLQNAFESTDVPPTWERFRLREWCGRATKFSAGPLLKKAGRVRGINLEATDPNKFSEVIV